MALLKAEAEKLSLPDLQQGVIDHIVTSDEVFSVLPFEPVNGKTKDYNRENTLGSAEFYAVGDVLAESAATFTKISEELRRLIGQVDVDNFLETQMSDQQSQVAVQIAKKSKVVGRTFALKLMQGDSAVDANEFDGLLKIAAGLPSTQRILNEGGAALTYDMLDELLDVVIVGDNPVYIMNSRTIRSYVRLQRALGGTTPETVSVGGVVFSAYRQRPILKNDFSPLDTDHDGTIRNTLDQWVATTAYIVGDKVRDLAAGLPGLIFECTTAGTSDAAEPTWDEDPGDTTADGTVVWTTNLATLATIQLASMDEMEGLTGLMAARSAGVTVEDLGPLETKDANRFRVKWYASIALKSALALAQVQGVNN